MTFDEIISISPYSLNKDEKSKLLTERLVELTEFHQANCPEYKKILGAINYNKNETIQIYHFFQSAYLRIWNYNLCDKRKSLRQ